MRRKDFEQKNEHEVNEFLAERTYGILGLHGEDGWPYLVPLNFVYHNGHIYFHGSRIGQKIHDLRANEKVSFAVADEYALIPSYFSDPKLACPATAFFKSVLIRGHASLIEDVEEKASVFGALMNKLQKEGGYAPISVSDPDYVPQLKGTAVVKITIDSLTAKFKFGQNWKPERRCEVEQALQKRSAPRDEETIAHMRKYCPAHKEG
ncbi:pyridoxamine 5'-phosphate oxidase family protein [Xylanibacillus composti]|uniref:MFS transporter n=1 Tax=Xylanibacillus composti TaxID=1572762 RepID=A0A8J4M0E5_9BACL|nr:pyridoxamine 5'-phosphate oxidase family protein [Xylanibacillus composti]MDT9723852.1 pyridoxamine 5'-phosphate oxidase family protein [Xylanibacillus composti]GIQ67369.1 MFS transporter [Xylanibacillus composti]